MRKENILTEGRLVHCIILDSGFWILDSSYYDSNWHRF